MNVRILGGWLAAPMLYVVIAASLLILSGCTNSFVPTEQEYLPVVPEDALQVFCERGKHAWHIRDKIKIRGSSKSKYELYTLKGNPETIFLDGLADGCLRAFAGDGIFVNSFLEESILFGGARPFLYFPSIEQAIQKQYNENNYALTEDTIIVTVYTNRLSPGSGTKILIFSGGEYLSGAFRKGDENSTDIYEEHIGVD